MPKSAYAAKSDAARDVDLGRITRSFIETVRGYGFEQVYYVHVAQQFRRIPGDTGVRIRNVTSEWLKRYAEKGYSRDRPGVMEAQKRAAPFQMTEFERDPNLTARQGEFVNDLREAGFREILFLPIFAKPGDFAVFGLATSHQGFSISDEKILELRSLSQEYHLQYNNLTAPRPDPLLSPREVEVLELIARGKSNQAIARTLGVSNNTIDTLVRRAFSKLEVTNRVEAVLTAISFGLILP